MWQLGSKSEAAKTVFSEDIKKEKQQQLSYLHFRSQENTSRSHEHWIYTFQRIPAKQQTAHDVQASHGSKQQQVMMMTVSV